MDDRDERRSGEGRSECVAVTAELARVQEHGLRRGGYLDESEPRRLVRLQQARGRPPFVGNAEPEPAVNRAVHPDQATTTVRSLVKRP